MNPTVSVVTCFLNAEKYLEEAVQSVIAQTYPHWELLLIDDGSRDRSSALAKSFAARYPEKIRYLEHPGHKNLGKSTSRNLGIREANGKYVALLDADDLFLPEKLDRQVGVLESHPEAGLIYGPTEH